MVRKVLTDAAKKGLPGEHHFFITFDTKAPGVRLSARMREQYPEEMTIVLQHQFWDLKVSEDSFEVGLSFGGVPESLLVPFEAIKSFFDPSVQFGLQFETIAEAASATPAKPDKPTSSRRPSRGCRRVTSRSPPRLPPAAGGQARAGAAAAAGRQRRRQAGRRGRSARPLPQEVTRRGR